MVDCRTTAEFHGRNESVIGLPLLHHRRSALGWFVLHEVVGYPRVRSYDEGGPSTAVSSALPWNASQGA